MSQRKRIAELLKRGWTSPLDALKKAGSMKLATRVGELRSQYVIEDKWDISKKFKLYRIVKEIK